MDGGGRKINKAGEVSRAALLSIFKARKSEKQASSAVSLTKKFKFQHFLFSFSKLQI